MRFATISTPSGPAAAVQLEDGGFLPIAPLAQAAGVSDPALLDGGLQALIEGGDAALAKLAEILKGAHGGAVVSAQEVQLLAPLPKPAKNVFCVGRNYADHIAEGARALKADIKVTEVPVFFTKPSTTVIGPNAEIPIFLSVSDKIDYEVELAVIIGKSGRNIAADGAMSHVWGYTVLNDITARDVQRRHGGQFFKGKALDGSCPMGPVIVTADEIAQPHNLALRTYVNGEIRQDGNTGQMIFDIPTLIASLSEGLTLSAGDILATGTPSGVGYAMEPPCFLTEGDEVMCQVEGIGELKNTLRNI
ncbi:fumarylacetoacetate hydrolase family protein [Albirhodobacter sp. R86504]|uniref:fumarylacetoacetate hydrolase family protein n=1 Tax=Albirhodobacter sp. R86504 TaxID=3093848 RepID=UPI0036702F84